MIAQQQQQILDQQTALATLQEQLQAALAVQQQPYQPAPAVCQPQLSAPAPFEHIARATHKPQLPKPFSGTEKVPGAVFTWLFQMQLYFQAAKVPVGEWPVMAATNLEGIAALWLQNHAIELQWHNISWQQLSDALVQAIVPDDLQLRDIDTLLEYRQGTKGVDEYAQHFCCLALACPQMSQQVAAVQFERGLQGHLQGEVFRRNPLNLQAAILAARQAEVAARCQGNGQPPKEKPQQQQRQQHQKPKKQQKPNPQGKGKEPFCGTCHKCGKVGHKAHECRSMTNNQYRNNQPQGKGNTAQLREMQVSLNAIAQSLSVKTDAPKQGN